MIFFKIIKNGNVILTMILSPLNVLQMLAPLYLYTINRRLQMQEAFSFHEHILWLSVFWWTKKENLDFLSMHGYKNDLFALVWTSYVCFIIILQTLILLSHNNCCCFLFSDYLIAPHFWNRIALFKL